MCIKNPAVFGYSGGVYSSDGLVLLLFFAYLCCLLCSFYGAFLQHAVHKTFDYDYRHKYDECTDTGISGTAGYSRL